MLEWSVVRAPTARRASRGTGPSRTAWGAAVCRLIEQEQPSAKRLFSDPVVGLLLDQVTATMAAGPMLDLYLSTVGSGTYGARVMRTRYIDDVVTAFVEGGATQVVILGAGLDTRAFRLPVLAPATVFEVDLPGTQRYKVERLRYVRALAAAVRFVPADFTMAPLADVLAEAGFDRSIPVLFVWEGVTQYLPEAAVRSILTYIGGCVPGSAVVFTYVLRSIVDHSAGSRWSGGQLPQLDASEPWLFGLEPGEVPSLLDGYGLNLIDDAGGGRVQVPVRRTPGPAGGSQRRRACRHCRRQSRVIAAPFSPQPRRRSISRTSAPVVEGS